MITPTELRQHHYCPRIVFFERCTPVRRRETVLMTTGRDQHQAELERERRRTLSRYTLRAGERRYDVRLTSEPLQLTGELDLLIVDGAIAFPVEFKHAVRPQIPDTGSNCAPMPCLSKINWGWTSRTGTGTAAARVRRIPSCSTFVCATGPGRPSQLSTRSSLQGAVRVRLLSWASVWSAS